jgi:hypothetical protein
LLSFFQVHCSMFGWRSGFGGALESLSGLEVVVVKIPVVNVQEAAVPSPAIRALAHRCRTVQRLDDGKVRARTWGSPVT